MRSDHARRSAPDSKAWAASRSAAPARLPQAAADWQPSPWLEGRPTPGVRQQVATAKPAHKDARNLLAPALEGTPPPAQDFLWSSSGAMLRVLAGHSQHWEKS